MGLMRVIFSGKGTLPVLERSLAFTEKRQVLLSQNLANVDTNGYKAKDLNEAEFKKLLSSAVDNRKKYHPRQFKVNGGNNISVDSSTGDMSFEVIEPMDDSVMRHDKNNITYESELSKIVKNGIAHRAYANFIKGNFDSLTKAISGRVQ